MTDLFQQFGGALNDFKIRNIDSDSLHEIIGEFAPLIGVAIDHAKDKTSNLSKDPPVTVKQEPLEEIEDNSTSNLSKDPTVTVKQEPLEEIEANSTSNAQYGQIHRRSRSTGNKYDVFNLKDDVANGIKVEQSYAMDLSVQPAIEIKVEVCENSDTESPLPDSLSRKRLHSDSITNGYSSSDNESLMKRIKTESNDTLFIVNAENEKLVQTLKIPNLQNINSTSPNTKQEPQTESNADVNSQDDSDGPHYLYAITSSKNGKFYKCLICQRLCDTKYHVKRHILSHGGSLKPFQCDQCDKSFSQKCDLNRHLNVHNTARNFTCSVCGKSFKRSDYLAKHERQYCGVLKPFKCQKCHKGFEDENQVRVHTCMDKNNATLFACENCPETFNTVDALVEHRKAHMKVETDFQCSKCGKKFTEFMAYVDHFKNHSGERPYRCDLCQKVFSRNHNLMTHMLIHSQEKKHTCQICAKAFTYYSNLQVHLRVHRNERPYICKICDKGFLTSSDLRRHQRVHSGEKPYKCKHCKAEYARKERLISHLVIHIEEGMLARGELGGDGGLDSSMVVDDTSKDSLVIESDTSDE
ncbi:zinc finger protein 271-like [Dreissena polymorpha]|uniref:C2H2-type domain-containing protein n=1 Tax=Dreissena polymorpha TaxID=45954 RepID=A0A9D3YA99_DREPO|nr:zinc finger protein 271-like [Dreissena polymorpha]XP_052257352.1 zinc finger protein 271-like [Dreissena polymorpha]KAH3694695.1 hypothetical protein DPMN_082136 [Dreissena polymorpha]